MKRFVFIIALIATSAVYVPEVAYSQISDGESIISVNRTPVLKAVLNGIEITVHDGVARRFCVYSITGQVIKSVDVADNVTVELPQGYYIVKCSEWTKKIVVR